jgi:hypothetical protein
MKFKTFTLFYLFVLFCSISLSAQVIQLNKGLVLHFPFDGSTKDITSNKALTEFSNATFVDDRNGNALSAAGFNGSTDYISIKLDRKVFSKGAKSISFWANPLWDKEQLFLSLGGRYRLQLGNFSGGKLPSIHLKKQLDLESLIRNRHSYDYFSCYKGGEDYSYHLLQEDRWYHFTYLIDVDRFSVWINGEEYFSCYYDNKLDLVWNGYLTLGVDHKGYGKPAKKESSYFYGYLDDLRIYDRALNPDEIKELAKFFQKNSAPELDHVDFVDVDTDIPVTKNYDENRYALVIGNEQYEANGNLRTGAIPNSSQSTNDAIIFSKYASGTMAVNPKKNFTIIDADRKTILDEITKLKNLSYLKKGKAEIILYYSGHMILDDDNDLCLVPVDAQRCSSSKYIKLDDIYDQLTENPAAKITLFLDGCYNGFTKTGEDICTTKGLIRKKNSSTIPGNIVVFTAASEGQSAYVHNQSRHGIFTYFLLLKLKETHGNITLREMHEFLKEKVGEYALIEKGHQQQYPNFLKGQTASDWFEWKFHK